MVAMSLNYGYNFVTKALEQGDQFISFKELKKMLVCLSISMTVDEEIELREFLISKNYVKVERRDMLLDVELSLDTTALSEMLKAKIKKSDPSANFDEFSKFPEDPKAILNNFKSDLIESCLEDLHTRAKIFVDKDNYIPEIRIKEVFYETFPCFNTTKLDQFLIILENKRKASKLNYYQDSYSLNEILYKIREGEGYRQDDLANFKSSMRLVVAQQQIKMKARDNFNGELLSHGKFVFKQSERVPELEDTVKKMMEIFELINENTKVKSIAQRGLVEPNALIKPHSRFGSVETPKIDKIDSTGDQKDSKFFKSDELPLTLPLIKLCLADDIDNSGKFREEVFVSLIIDCFPSITQAEGYQLSALGYDYKTGEVDYMAVVKELEKSFKKISNMIKV